MKFALNLPKFPQKAAPVASADPAPEPADTSFLARLMDRKRLMRVAALLLVAGAAGQVMQSMNRSEAASQRTATKSLPQAAEPMAIKTVSGEGALAAKSAEVVDPVVQIAVAPVLDETSPVMIAAAQSAAMVFAPTRRTTVPAELAPTPVALTDKTEAPTPAPMSPAAPSAQPLADACPTSLDLSVVPGAMIGVTLIAPCAPNARVVLKHEGLAVTGLTTSTGSLFTSLPALTPAAKIEAVMADGTRIEASLQVPEALNFRRFGVQWQGDDAFQVNAYHDGASFGGAGHIYGVRPGVVADAGGFLQILGDASAPMPLLAEVYTFPSAQIPVDLAVEAAVTEKTCGRELLGETIAAQAGKVVVTDLTLAMPDCSAIGDFLVLNNLAQDMTLAAN